MALIRDCRQILLPILSKFKQIYQLLAHLKLSKSNSFSQKMGIPGLTKRKVEC